VSMVSAARSPQKPEIMLTQSGPVIATHDGQVIQNRSWHLSNTRLVPVAKGWAKNCVNAVIFRRNSVTTHEGFQYVAYYGEDKNVMLAKRSLAGDTWDIKKTPYQGNAQDAHNAISIMVDGDGYLHMSWDHHNHALRYCRSVTPGSLELTEKLPMTGKHEGRVTYPEFYRLANGNLLFLYRDGSSGQGNLMMNFYDRKTQTWTQRQNAFIHGEGHRNAYWQMCTDTQGAIHISWVWRETGDIATNHDMGYAKSIDEGKTWQKSSGETYPLPITAGNAEYAARIPQNTELINTTSMCADAKGRPYIATYWRPQGTDVPQYHLIYHDGFQWHTQQISRRTTPFRLNGGGTKRIPIARPQIFADSCRGKDKAYMLFRDIERKDRVSIAICQDLQTRSWTFKDLTDFSVGLWEPGYDTELWKYARKLHVYVQNVDQGDGDRNDMTVPPTNISILEWTP